jgi:CheY-like chemotaxis protein
MHLLTIPASQGRRPWKPPRELVMSIHATVLVIDDNPGDITLIKEAFRDCSVEVDLHEASNAVQGFTYLGRIKRAEVDRKPAVVILDLNMPIFSGDRVLEFIKSEPQLRDIPVVVWTSSDLPADRDLCHRLGADEFLVKPHDYAEYQKTAQGIKRRYVGCCHETDCALAPRLD